MKKMIYCDHCGHAAYNDMARCPQCGAQLSQGVDAKPSIQKSWHQFWDQYGNFSHKLPRRPFWKMQLWFWSLMAGLTVLYRIFYQMSQVVTWLVPNDITITTYSVPASQMAHFLALIIFLWGIIMLIPLCGAMVQRLRDVGLSKPWLIGWLILLLFPGLNVLDVLIGLVVACLPSNALVKGGFDK